MSMPVRRLTVVVTLVVTVLFAVLLVSVFYEPTLGHQSQTMPTVFDSPIVAGTVFDDRNASGYQEGAEPGLEGVTVTLLHGGGPISTTTTSGKGAYGFICPFLGDYTVRETNPGGYVSTTPDEVAVSLTEAGDVAIIDFGDQRPYITYLPVIAKNYP